ncbi:MAG: outer membrane lipid asymmetry maintenance protein MlaD [Rhodobacteraceae bacterium]|nr:outer membrane lipid asymmetry maintenance protein MlaD [Paracoccaceae bacterium]
MAYNPTELAVGAAVLAVAGSFLAYALTAVGGTSSRGGYELTASFRSVEGVNVGTDIRLAGVKVGSVAAITLDPESFRADTTLALSQNVPLPDDSAVVVATEGLLGGTFLEVLPGGSPFNYEPGAEIVDTQGTVNIISLLSKFVSGE